MTPYTFLNVVFYIDLIGVFYRSHAYCLHSLSQVFIQTVVIFLHISILDIVYRYSAIEIHTLFFFLRHSA